jgi:hypothetical protein
MTDNEAPSLRITNQDSVVCSNIKIEVNEKYRGMVPKLNPGEASVIHLSEFKNEEGQPFPSGEEARQITIHAENPSGLSGGVQYGGQD